MSVLQTIDLKKYYGTEPNITRALDGVNFSVEDGEFVAVVGTSGSGKSIACCLIAIYGRNPMLFVSTIILGVGHIGIHLNHRKEL